jgi:hypothetical protein
MESFAAGLVILALSANAGGADATPTRFGVVSVDARKTLLLRDQPVEPRVVGNNGLEVVRRFTAGDADLILVRDAGGTACPSLFRIVALRGSGVSVSRAFGSCGELIQAKQAEGKVSVATRDYRGPFEPPAERAAAARRVVDFVYADGELTENGKPLR